MGNLRELADRVEAGEVMKSVEVWSATDRVTGPEIATNALWGSLDAAKALHDAVLPGWEYSISYEEKEAVVSVYSGREGRDGRGGTILNGRLAVINEHNGYAKTPAAAWVAAILRAKHSMEESK